MFTRTLTFLALAIAAYGQTRSRMAEYAVVLKDEPVARRVASRAAFSGSEGQAHARAIRSAQGPVRAELQRRGLRITGATQMLVNAVIVSATPEAALELSKMPGVKYVIRAPRVRPNLDRAEEASNVAAAWAAVGGSASAGAGVKIGIIDSGLDLTHPGLQDPSLTPPAGFPKGNTAYTNSKVIVARSYIASDLAPGFTSDRANTDPAAISQPDDDTPRDHIGHGTALAMIAAGAPNTNAANGISIQGVAPKAFLGNYKVFGSPGLNDYTSYAAVEHAMRDAIADGMDVVTLSLSEGDPTFFAPLDTQTECDGPCDIYAQAVENAVKAGVTVVVSAGNSGNSGLKPQSWMSIHSPGTSPSAITVGALVNSRTMYQSIKLSGRMLRARFGTGPQLQAPLTATMKDAGLACSALPAGSLAGSIALIQRGDCFFDQKINNAQAAGAVGAIVYLDSGDDILSTTLLASTTGIPSALVGNTDGVSLKAGSGATVTLDPAFTAYETTGNTVWPASSRGPSPGDFGNVKTNVIKPEIAAVGANLYTAAQRLDPSGDAYNVSGYTSVTGTSYAAAVVAGAAALVKQKNPGWSPAQIKSAVVNTAAQDVQDYGATASVRSVGAGRLNAGAAVAATFTASPATISFGAIATTAALPINRNLVITNSSASTVTFSFSVDQTRSPDANARVTVSSTTGFGIGAGGTGSVTVSLSGTRPSPGAYEGFIVIQGNNQTIRVPYLYMVGDGNPVDVYAIRNGSFQDAPGGSGWGIAVRVVDAAGVPVARLPIQLSVVSGDGHIGGGDSATDTLGDGGGFVDLGQQLGEQTFRITVGGPQGPHADFTGFARPYPALTLAGVVNAATFQPGVAPGSYISIYGSDLVYGTQVESTPYLPVILSGFEVTFDGGGLSLPGRLHFVSPDHINVQVPWEFQGQTSVKMKVWSDYLPSNVLTVPLQQYAPGIFAQTHADYSPITQANPAKKGETIVLWMNGLGPVSATPATGEATPALTPTNTTPTVTIGGKAGSVYFSGLTPGVVGLYQVNVTLAADTPSGDQAVAVSIGGVSGKATTIAVQ